MNRESHATRLRHFQSARPLQNIWASQIPQREKTTMVETVTLLFAIYKEEVFGSIVMEETRASVAAGINAYANMQAKANKVHCLNEFAYIGFKFIQALEHPKITLKIICLYSTGPSNYVKVSSGTSCRRITSKCECERAAEALGLSDTTVTTETAFSYPIYCYYHVGSRLYYNEYNEDDGSTFECESNKECLCKNGR